MIKKKKKPIILHNSISKKLLEKLVAKNIYYSFMKKERWLIGESLEPRG